jgi:hypothetical protein
MMKKRQLPHPLIVTIVLFLGAVVLFWFGFEPLINTALLFVLAGLTYLLLPILIPPMNVKIPVFDQNDQSYEKDVLLDHLEVEPAEPPGRSAEEGKIGSSIPQ